MNNIGQNTQSQRTPALIVGFLVIAGLYASSLYSYLLFHTLIELFGIVVSLVIFVLAWNTRQVQENHYLLFLGIALLFTGALELLHTLAYKGFGVFPAHDANLPTQLWIAFRYLAAFTFLVAPLFIKRKLDVPKMIAVYALGTSLMIGAIFLELFPECFIEGRGLTRFKIYSEYVIILMFLAGLGLLNRHGEFFDLTVLRLMDGAILASVLSELSFTQYVSVFGPANMIGHFFLLASVACIYKAIVVTGMVDPTRLLFRNLKLSEEKVSSLNEELSKSVVKLEAANRELEAFSYSVSHDLRAPLRHISGFAESLAEDYAGGLDAQGKDYLARIQRGAEKMNRLIDDLLRLSQISRQEMKLGEVNLSKMASSILWGLRESDPGRKAAINVMEGIEAAADHRLMEIVLANLLGNAWKFTSKTGNTQVEFGAMNNLHPHLPAGQAGLSGVGVVYYVRDNGSGFSPEFSEKMFLPFHRLHTDKEFEGTGIGLAIVERIIRRHGGRVWAEGEVGKGATVYFTLR
jgi:signal transduction histidine kinase